VFPRGDGEGAYRLAEVPSLGHFPGSFAPFRLLLGID
jgi:hypothetical protein